MVGTQSFSDKLTSKVKNTYYYFEDKWYATLDKIQPKIPVYKIIDPVDEVIPSFILFLMCILFLFILAGYLIGFSTPYTMTFTTYDSASKEIIFGVDLAGIINDTDFELTTNSKGIAQISVPSKIKNLYSLIGQIVFGGEDEFAGTFNATKDGYTSIRKKDLRNGMDQKIYLEPMAQDVQFVGQTRVSLYDSVSRALIIDVADLSQVKFNCANKNSLPKTVRDGTDGTIDGIFILNENNCDFVLTYAKAEGYEKLEPETKVSTTQTEKIYLTKQENDITGTAKITVTDTNNTLIEGISVNFVGVSGAAITDSTGVARKQLQPGNYTITITDENYYSITPDNNIFIEIKTGEYSEKTVVLRKKNLTDSRKILIKVIDTNNTIISGADTQIFWLTKDGNNTTNISSNGSVLPHISGTTDTNGLFESRVFSIEDFNKLILIIDKEEYLLQEAIPTLKILTDTTPQTIIIEKATATNSANALIIAKGGDNNRPIVNASSYVAHTSLINGLPYNIAYPPKDTNLSGMSSFDRLPPGNYFAGAKYKSIKTKTSLSAIDVAQTKIFNLHFDMNLAELEVVLKDMETGQIILNQSQGSVKVYSFDTDPGTKTLYENLIFRSNKFVNQNGYDIENNFIIEANLTGYIKNNIIIYASRDLSSNPLKQGLNEFVITLPKDITVGRGDCNGNWVYTQDKTWVCVRTIPTNCQENKYKLDGNNLVCNTVCNAPDQWIAWQNGFMCYPNDFPYSANGSVGIFYNNIYSTLAKAENEVADVDMIEKDETYNIKFRTVIYDSDLTYKELFSMTRFNGATSESLFEYSGLSSSNILKQISCNSQNLDGANTRDQNYYFPNCLTQTKEQSAIKWFNNNLEIKTYNFINKFKVTNDTNQSVTINYRASEKDTNSSSETSLQEKQIEIGKLLTTGLFAKIKLNTTTTNFNFSNLNPVPANLDYDVRVPLEITVYNNRNTNITSGKISVYSYNGNLNNFNKTSSGTINFDNNSTKEVISTTAVVPRFSNETYTTTAIATKLYSSNYIIVLIEIDNEEYTAIFDVSTMGTAITLDAEFLSGVNNPKIYGAIYSKLGGEVNIKEATVKIDINCDAKTTQGALDNSKIENTFNVSSSGISGNVFEQTVNGVYKDHADCAWISVIPQPTAEHYQSIIDKRVLASPSDSFDPALACIQATDLQGETEIIMNWNDNKTIQIDNTCTKPVRIKIESGVVCEIDGTNCNTQEFDLVANDKKQVILKGMNNSYNTTDNPNFSDILGLFPVYIKAKYTDNLKKKYALADLVVVHLSNDKQCFSISQDEFDMTSAQTANFVITNQCQDTTIDDSLIPSTTINSFGYDINSGNSVNNTPVQFDVNLVINGTTYSTTQIKNSTFNKAWKEILVSFKDLPPSQITQLDNNTTKYSNVEYIFDLDDINAISNGEYRVNNVLVGVIDINNQFYDINTPYGAQIDGNILLTYQNNTTKIIPIRDNLKIIPEFGCKQPIIYECIYGNDLGQNIQFDDWVYGTVYLDLNNSEKGKIKSVKLSFIGNQDSEILRVRLIPIVDYNTFDIIINTTAGTLSEEKIKLGTFSIPPVNNIISHIKSLDNITEFNASRFIGKSNPRVFVETNNSKVIAWISGNSLKAKYIGEDYAPDNDTTLERTLVKESGQGTNYSLINIIDYVNTIVAGANNKIISGAQ
ncbi:MAG: carboxypeptidase-like regulatory domain-containing protein [archaeon]|jgi:hypothetical protein